MDWGQGVGILRKMTDLVSQVLFCVGRRKGPARVLGTALGWARLTG